jgi:hypothetical protein
MKKLMLVFGLFAFVAIAGASAQCAKSSASCCAKKSSTSASTTAVAGDDMIKKVANTSEAKPACCAKGGDAKSCKKDAPSCHGGSAKVTDAVAPAAANKMDAKVVRQVVPISTTATANEKK